MSRNIASTKSRKIGGLRNYQRGGNLKKGEVNFERGGGSDPLGNYGSGLEVMVIIAKIQAVHLGWTTEENFAFHHY